MLYKKSNKIAITSILSAFLLTTNVYANNLTSTMIDGKAFYYEKDSINLIVNGVTVADLPMEPIVYQDYVLVPVREVLEPFGIYIDYVQDLGLCTLVKGDSAVRFYVNNPTAIVNQESRSMGIPAKIVNDKLMVPLRFVSESFGLNIDWNPISRTVSVDNFEVTINVDEKVIEEDKIPEGNYVEEFNELYQTNEEDKKDETINNTIIDLTEENLSFVANGQTSITKASKTAQGIVIQFSSALSFVDRFESSGNRLVLDISNAKLDTSEKSLDVNDDNLYQVRLGEDPEKNVARVVLDMKDNVKFKVNYSADRTKIYVNFEENVVSEITYGTSASGDEIVFQNSKSILPKIDFIPNPDRVVIDFANSNIEKTIDEAKQGKFITHIRTSQEENNTGRIVVYLNSQSTLQVLDENDKFTIKFLDPTTRNIHYDYENRRLVMKKDKKQKLDIDSLIHKDNYLDLHYQLEFVQNISNEYGYGKLYIGDGLVNFIDITHDGNTKIDIEEKQLMLCTFDEDDENYYINFRTPKEEYPLVVVLDAGHGGHDGGAAGNGVQEKFLNRDVTERLFSLIESEGKIKAYLTKEGDTFISLNERARRGNSMGDAFVSIHSNSSKNSTPMGTEVYYYNHSNDAEIGFYSSSFAKIINTNLVNEIGSFDRGVKTNSFVVIKYTTVPAILIEMGFVSNPYEAALLGTPEYRQKIAEGIYKGLLETSSVYSPAR